MTLAAPIRVLVVDDEPLARRNVTVLLRGDSEIESVSECGSGVEAIEIIRRWQPHLVFLDAQMPECGGFDVLELLGTELPPAIIFVTAYDEYALRAFEVGALDYLLKPFDDARFHRALQRAKDKLALYAVGAVGQPTRRLVVRSPGQLVNVERIQGLELQNAGEYEVVLKSSVRLRLSRRFRKRLQDRLAAMSAPVR